MPTYQPPKKNTQLIVYISLVSQANPKIMQANPTIATGDFKVTTDGGSLANLSTLPVVTPAGSSVVKVTLSASEMNGDNVTLVCSDAAGAEWCDLALNFATAARQVDDLMYPATSGRSTVVDANGLVDATTVKIGPTGSGTAQTARDLGASVLLSSGTGTGQIDISGGVIATVNAVNGINPSGISSASFAAGAITSGSIADGALTAAKFAAASLDGKGDWSTTAALAALVSTIGTPAGASVSADIAANPDANIAAMKTAFGDGSYVATGAVTSMGAGVITESAFTIPTPTANVAPTGPIGWLNFLFARFGGARVKKNSSALTIATYLPSDSATVWLSGSYTTTASTDTTDDVAKAS